MHSSQLLSALAAAGLAHAASASTCTADVKITEATPTIDCEVAAKDVVVSSDVAGALSIENLKQIKGSLIIQKADITSLSSSSINSIGKNFELQGLQLLESVTMSSLATVGGVSFANLGRLGSLAMNLTEVKTVEITDTFLPDLSSFNVETLESIVVTNNNRIASYNPDLVSVTGDDGIKFQGNSQSLEIELNKLENATQLEFQNIKSLAVPSLTDVTKSLNIIDGTLTSFSADNLTEISGDLAFRGNDKLTNVSFPELTKIGGGLDIRENEDMESLVGFPKLATVSGGLSLGGNFEEVELPSLEDVKGSSNVSSTTDIKDFCEFFEEKKSEDVIQGEAECSFNNKDALKGDTDGGEKADGSSSSGSSSDDDEGAAGALNINMAGLGLALVFGIAQLL